MIGDVVLPPQPEYEEFRNPQANLSSTRLPGLERVERGPWPHPVDMRFARDGWRPYLNPKLGVGTTQLVREGYSISEPHLRWISEHLEGKWFGELWAYDDHLIGCAEFVWKLEFELEADAVASVIKWDGGR